MRQEIQEVFNFAITAREVIANTLMATFCGAIISLFYILSFRGVSYSINLIRSIVMLSMITAFVMMVIGDNLARAFGMVGVLSIIQFRAAMKGAQDFMFLFFSLAMGLACGAGLYLPSLVGCVLIGVITVGMGQLLAGKSQRDFTLSIIRLTSDAGEKEYDTILQAFCKKYKLVGRKTSTKENKVLMRLNYVVKMKNDSSSEAFVSALKEVDGVQEVNLEFEKE